MRIRTFVMISGIIFTLVSLAHLIRALYGWQITVAQWHIPVYLSWLGFVVAAFLALSAFRLAGKDKSAAN